jgi:hypothetical protein
MFWIFPQHALDNLFPVTSTLTKITCYQNRDGNVKGNDQDSYLQCGRINNWKWRNGGSVYFIDKTSHVLFHSFTRLLNYFSSLNWIEE